MRALAWLREETWRACVDAIPAAAEVTLLHVAAADAEHAAREARRGRLGRPLARPDRQPELEALSDEAAAALLASAAQRLGRPAERVARRGRVEREVLDALAGHDLLVVARDGDRRRPGPHSLGPPTRFVVDHAPCSVLLVWP
jgi:nucleotide-binding universal stress UspA family protein